MTTLAVAEAPPPQFQVVTLVGHLTSDPVLKQLGDGRSVCDMRPEVNDQKDQPPLFIDIATFGSSAEACAKYLPKGRAIAVTGKPTTAPAAPSTMSWDASASAAAPTSSPPMATTPPARRRTAPSRRAGGASAAISAGAPAMRAPKARHLTKPCPTNST